MENEIVAVYDDRGYVCMIVQHSYIFPVEASIAPQGWYTGYVGLPAGHPLVGDDCYDLDAHGGITYCQDDFPNRTKHECMWVIGYDTHHWGDDQHHIQNENYQKEQIKSMVDQLEAIAKEGSK